MAFNVGNCPIDYDVKPTLLASGLRDLDKGIRYTACKTEPSGDIILGPVNMRFNSVGKLNDLFEQPDYFTTLKNNKIYAKRIAEGEMKYKNQEAPKPFSDWPNTSARKYDLSENDFIKFVIYSTFQSKLSEDNFRKLLVSEPKDNNDLEYIGKYLYSTQPEPNKKYKVIRKTD